MDETRGRSYRRGPGVPTTDDKNPLHGDRPDVWGVSIMPEPLAECGDAVEGPAHTRPPVERAEARGALTHLQKLTAVRKLGAVEKVKVESAGEVVYLMLD